MIAGIDVGYGYTKGARLEGLRVVFPSVVAEDHETDDLGRVLGSSRPDHRATIEEDGRVRRYLFGNQALFARAVRTWRTSAAERPDYPVLVLAALRLLNVSGDVRLAVGLPLELFKAREERSALADRLSHLQAVVSVDNSESRSIRVVDTLVLPQSAAAYYALLRQEPSVALTTSGIIDLGFRTVDYLLMRFQRGQRVSQPDSGASGSLELGMERIYERVARQLRQEKAVLLEPSRVEDAVIMERDLTLKGERVNVAPLVGEASAALAREIADRLLVTWDMSELDHVFLTGGGGRALAPYLRELLPSVRLLPEPAYANAAGYAAMLTGSAVAAREA